MSYSGDAAEQVVRMSLEGAEVAAKITGAGAKQVAVLLYAILREQKKTKGKTRLTNMLRSGKELKVFAVKDTDLKQFCEASKKYGVLYCVLKDRNADDGITDVMVRAEDASKINRILSVFSLQRLIWAALRVKSNAAAARKPQRNSRNRSAVQPSRIKRHSWWIPCCRNRTSSRRGIHQTPHRLGRQNPLSPSIPQSPANEPSRVSLIENGYGHLYGRS